MTFEVFAMVTRNTALMLAVLAADTLAQHFQPEWRPSPKELAAALEGKDANAWSAAAGKLAAMRPDPLADGMFTVHPHFGGQSAGHVELGPALWKELASEDLKRRAETIEALVGVHTVGSPYGGMAWEPDRARPNSPTPEMVRLAQDKEPRVRAGALWLWRLSNNRRMATLAARLLDDGDAAVRTQAILAMTRFEATEDVAERIRRSLDDQDRNVRIAGMYAIVAHRLERAEDRVIALLNENDSAVRHAAVLTTGWLQLRRGAERLLQLLDDSAEGTVNWSEVVLPEAEGHGWWTRDLSRNTSTIAGAAIWALGELGDHRAVPRLLRELAIEGKGKVEQKGGVEGLSYPKNWHADAAALALGRIGDPRALAPLAKASSRGDVGHDARSALADMELSSGESIRYAPLSDSDAVLERRRWPDEICRFPRQFIPHIYRYKDVSPTDFLREVFAPTGKYPENHALSLVADFSRVRVGAIECLGRYIDSPELRAAMEKLTADEDPALAWGAIYTLTRVDSAKARSLLRKVPQADGDALLFAGLALTELGDPEAMPLLRPFLDARDVHWQILVARALFRLGDTTAMQRLAAIAEAEKSNSAVRCAAVAAIAHYGGENASHILENWVYRDFIAETALEGLSRLTTQGKFDRSRLVQALRGRIAPARLRGNHLQGVIVCAEQRIEECHDDLLVCLAAHDLMTPRPRGPSVTVPWAIAATGHFYGSCPLEKLLQDEHAEVRAAACRAVADAGDPSGIQPLIHLLDDRVWTVQVEAARALGLISAQQDRTPDVIAALRNQESSAHNLFVKLEAMAARAKLGDIEAKAAIEDVVKDGSEGRRMIARAALTVLGEKQRLSVLHQQLEGQLQETEREPPLRAYELIRLLAWCGDPSSLAVLEKIPGLPCADVDAYDCGESRRDLVAACAHAKWQIERAQRKK